MRSLVLAAVATAGLTLTVLPAAAQVGVQVGPGGAGVYVGPGGDGYDRGRGYDRGYDDRGYGPPPRDEWRISRGDAVRIARRNGLDEVRDVSRRGPFWVVRGISYRGRPMSVRVHSRDGRVSW